MLDQDIQSEVLVVDDRTESLYVYFRKNVRIKEGLRFVFNPIGRVLIYVGADDIPVAMQFVDRYEMHDEDICRAADAMTGEEAKQVLFGISCKMVAFVEAKRKALGNSLIRDALHVAKQLKNSQGLLCGS